MNAQATYVATCFLIMCIFIAVAMWEFGHAALAEYRENDHEGSHRGWLFFGLFCWAVMVAVGVYVICWLNGARVWPYP